MLYLDENLLEEKLAAYRAEADMRRAAPKSETRKAVARLLHRTADAFYKECTAGTDVQNQPAAHTDRGMRLHHN